jgi:hypothetical protein
MRRVLASVVFAAVAVLAGPVLAQQVALTLDTSRTLRLHGAASGVVVGDASVADVIVHEPNLLVIMGKATGSTHLLVVDARGRSLFDGVIRVSEPEPEGLVTVLRGKNQQTLACQPRCQPRPTVGDSADAFSAGGGQIQQRAAMTRGGGG